MLEKLFGKQDKSINFKEKKFLEWKFLKNGYNIQIYLTELPKRHIKIFEILKSNKSYLQEYEALKLKFNNKSYRDYQEAKFLFFNKILKE